MHKACRSQHNFAHIFTPKYLQWRAPSCYNDCMTVFVIAMDSEAKPVLDRLEDIKEKNVHGRRVAEGRLCGKHTAVVVCGVGKVNAAAGTQYAIDCLGADKIINIGVAGGLNDGCRVAEMYGIECAVQYDFDLVQINHTPMGTLDEYDRPYMELCTTSLYPLKKLATGDRFNDDEDDFRLLTKELKADIRDMEGGAAAHVCRHAGIPCYSFKAISDVAGLGSTTEQFLHNLELCSVKLGEETEHIFEAVNG